MKRKEALEKIKALLFGEQKCEQAKTSDGAIVQWDGELTEGSPLNIVDETGNVMPCPDGEVKLEDGTMITCVGGLVTKLTGPDVEVEKEPATAEDMASEFELAFAKHVEDFTAFMSRFDAMEAKVNEYESQFSAINETLHSESTDVHDKFAAITELIGKIAEEPAAPAEPVKNVLFSKKEKTKGWETYLKGLNK